MKKIKEIVTLTANKNIFYRTLNPYEYVTRKLSGFMTYLLFFSMIIFSFFYQPQKLGAFSFFFILKECVFHCSLNILSLQYYKWHVQMTVINIIKVQKERQNDFIEFNLYKASFCTVQNSTVHDMHELEIDNLRQRYVFHQLAKTNAF